MSKLPSFTAKSLIKKLQSLGFVIHRQSGSHVVMFHHPTKRRAVIPYHLKDIPHGTLSAILREAKITHQEIAK